MSTQSGIVASEELLNKFKDFKGNALAIKINSENTQLIPDPEFEDSSSPELSATFDKIRGYLEASYPNPAYVIVSVPEEGYSFISFVPDNAPIRQKMLYASTKNSLLTTLGSNNFIKNQVFSWTDLDEISYSHYKSATSDNKDVGLTDSEKVMKEIDSLQAMSLAESKGTSSFQKKLVSMSGGDNLLFDFDEKLSEKLEEEALAETGNNNVIIFNIGLPNEIFKLENCKSSVVTSNLINTIKELSATGPHYVLYNYHDLEYAFIYTCPSGSKVKDRMIYASLKRGLISHLKSILESNGKTLDKSLEVGDVEELEISELEPVDASVASTTSTNKNGLKFNKPKGPRRR